MPVNIAGGDMELAIEELNLDFIIINYDMLYYKADFGSGCFRFDRG